MLQIESDYELKKGELLKKEEASVRKRDEDLQKMQLSFDQNLKVSEMPVRLFCFLLCHIFCLFLLVSLEIKRTKDNGLSRVIGA